MEHPVVEAGAVCTARAVQPAEFRCRLRRAAPRVFYSPRHQSEFDKVVFWRSSRKSLSPGISDLGLTPLDKPMGRVLCPCFDLDCVELD